MKEEYIHLLWKLKRLPSLYLKLTDGRKLEIIDFGWYNTASGPDFFNGKIKIDGIMWSGNIEMHVKSSDWNLHQHDKDAAYNNVILHVVFENNTEIFVKEEKLPCLELKTMIDLNHYSKYQELNLSKTWISCENQIKNVPKIIIQQQIESSLINRLERKLNLIQTEFLRMKGDNLQLLYEFYAKTFGLKTNELPFLELSKKLPYNLIQNKSEFEIKSLMLGIAGILNPNEKKNNSILKEWNYFKIKYSLSEMNSISWKKKGLRPKSFPEIKLEEFAKFCSNNANFNIEYFDKLTTNSNFLTIDFLNLLKINVHSLFLWWKGKQKNDLTLQEKALNLLENVKPEKNSIINRWNKLGVITKNAFETQALIELKNEYCFLKKCSTCKIGVSLLNE